MPQLNKISLRDAFPGDRPHILLWNNPTELDLNELACRENAQRVSYRQNLLDRVPSQGRFLGLHRHLEKEIDSLRHICYDTDKIVVLLEDFDCLVTFLNTIANSPISLFWQQLLNLRQLESCLWILLPASLLPPDWPESRTQKI